MRRTATAAALLFFAMFASGDDDADLRAARSIFEQNLTAIKERNRDKYLACYLKSDKLVRMGPTGFVTGYESFAQGAGSGWPDTIEATDIHLTPIRAGIVYRHLIARFFSALACDATHNGHTVQGCTELGQVAAHHSTQRPRVFDTLFIDRSAAWRRLLDG